MTMLGYNEKAIVQKTTTGGGGNSGAVEAAMVKGSTGSVGVSTADRKAFQLTPLWEYVVRTKTLPENLDLDVVFVALQERLRNGEWEVRQHAMRVLVDVIPVVNDTLDARMERILPDLVSNMGHVGPAVRKGAMDCLRVYFHHSGRYETLLHDLIYKGLEKSHENHVQSNIITGIILALPAFIFPAKTSTELVSYSLRCLLDRTVQVTHQEVALRSLIHLREMIGPDNFEEHLEKIKPGSVRDVELLSEVYSIHGQNLTDSGVDLNAYPENRSGWSDMTQSLVVDTPWNSDSDGSVKLGEEIKKAHLHIAQKESKGKVILETEFNLDSGDAIKMTIHEEDDPNVGEQQERRRSITKALKNQTAAAVSDSEDDKKKVGVVKVLSDSECFEYDEEENEDDEFSGAKRKTPRRVRFGGEHVKLRTPDSDNNLRSEDDADNDKVITIITTTTVNVDGGGDKPVIQISTAPASRVTTGVGGGKGGKVGQRFAGRNPGGTLVDKSISRIPVRITTTTNKSRSLPASPSRRKFTSSTKIKSKSTSILSSDSVFGSKLYLNSKIPRRTTYDQKTTEKTNTKKHNLTKLNVNLKINDNKDGSHKSPTSPVGSTHSSRCLRSLSSGNSSRRSSVSPVIEHKEIELFHNLTRSPERQDSSKDAPPKFPSNVPAPAGDVQQPTGGKRTSASTERVNRFIPIDVESSGVIEGKVSEEAEKKLGDKPVKPENKKVLIRRDTQTLTDSKDLALATKLPNITSRPPWNASTSLDDTKPNSGGGKAAEFQANSSQTTSKTSSGRSPRVQLSNSNAGLGLGFKPLGAITGTNAIVTIGSNSNNLSSDTTNNGSVVVMNGSTFNSFRVFPTSFADGDAKEMALAAADSPIPNLDNGDCLTCSSSGSDIARADNSWEDLGLVDHRIITDIYNKDDWRIRLRGLESLLQTLQNPAILLALEPRATSLLHFLFNTERHPRLQHVCENCLAHIIMKISSDTLCERLGQFATGLSRMGSPAGVRLAVLLGRRTPPADLVDHLLRDSAIGAKSSRTREGAIQIILTIARIFPSTEIDVQGTSRGVAMAVNDRKRRVRQAALDTLAALAQIGSTGTILQAVVDISDSGEERNQLLSAVRARLSRKQLASVGADGSIRYASPDAGPDAEWIAAGSGSLSPRSAPAFPAAERRGSTNPVGVATVLTGRSADSGRGSISGNQQRSYWQNTGQRCQLPEAEEEWTMIPVSPTAKEDPSRFINSQLWAIDPAALPASLKLSASNGTLHPVYVLQSSRPGSKLSDTSRSLPVPLKQAYQPQRGRSFSPPKQTPPSAVLRGSDEPISGTILSRRESGASLRRTFSDKNVSTERFISTSGGQPIDYQNVKPERERKRSSSEGRRLQPLSSGSSVSSGGSPHRSVPSWHSHSQYPSGIPVPISSEARLRIKRKSRDPGLSGPMSVAQHVISRVKPPTPMHDGSEKATPIYAQHRAVLPRHQFSSGSESSISRTPPTDPYVPPPVCSSPEDHHMPPIHTERFIQLEESTTPSEDTQSRKTLVIEEALQRREIFAALNKENSVSSFDEVDFENNNNKNTSLDKRIVTGLSKSVDNLKHNNNNNSHLSMTTNNNSNMAIQNILNGNDGTELLERKSISSAPSLNEIIDSSKYKNYDDTPVSALSKSSLISNNTEMSVDNYSEEVFEKEDSSPPQTAQAPAAVILPPTSINRTIKIPTAPMGALQDINGSMSSGTARSRPALVKRTSLSCRQPSTTTNRAEVALYPSTLRPFAKPREALGDVLAQLQSPEWEQSMRGLQGLVRLSRHHRDTVESSMHSVCVATARNVRNLRSQVARAACHAAAEMFAIHGKSLDIEIEELAVPLLHRTADTNKFLRSDANKALDEMTVHLSSTRVITVLTVRGGGHQNAIVRCTTARLMCVLVNRLGYEKVFQLPKETRDRLLASGAVMLTEGSLETRKHAKLLLSLLANHPHFFKTMLEVVPTSTMRLIGKVLRNLKQ